MFQKIMLDFCVFLLDYFAFEPPKPWPVRVQVNFIVNEVFEVNLDEGTLTLQLYITSKWHDPRVAVLLPKSGPYGTKQLIPIRTSQMEHIWNPQTQIYNARTEQGSYIIFIFTLIERNHKHIYYCMQGIRLSGERSCTLASPP